MIANYNLDTSTMKRTLFLVVFIVLPLFLSGCSNHVPLTGRVTYSDDDTPLEIGRVIFEPETGTFHARGNIGADGRYKLATNKPGDGLPPGKYRVYLTDTSQWISNNEARTSVEVPFIESKFNSPDTSELVIDVKRSTRTFDFKVDRAPDSKK